MDRAEVRFDKVGNVRKAIPANFPVPRDAVILYESEVTSLLAFTGLAPKVIASDAESITLAYGGVSFASLFADDAKLFKELDSRPAAAAAILIGQCRLLKRVAATGALIVDANFANFLLALADMKQRSGRLMLQSALSIDHLWTMHSEVLMNKPFLLAVGEKHNPVIAPETRKMIASGQAQAAKQLGFRNWGELCRILVKDPTYLHARWAELDVYYDKIPDIERAMQYSLGITAKQMAETVDLEAIRPIIDRMCMPNPSDRYDSYDDIEAAILAVYPELPVESLHEMKPVIELTRPQVRSSALLPSESEFIEAEEEPPQPMPQPEPREEEVVEPEELMPTGLIPRHSSTDIRPWGRRFAVTLASGLVLLAGLGVVGHHLASPQGVLLRSQLRLADDAFRILDDQHRAPGERATALTTIAGIAVGNRYVRLRTDAVVARYALRAPEVIATAKSKDGKAELNVLIADLKTLNKGGHKEAGLLVAAIDAAASGNAARIRQAMEKVRGQPDAARATAILEQAQRQVAKPT